MAINIWRKKPLSAFEADMKKSELKQVLGKWSLTAIGIGAIIGGGIFVLTGTAAHYHAGPALALSFVVAGIACIFAALCYAEFASMLPVEGSAYAYAYGTVGELFAWVIGWGLILEYAMGAMTVAVSWSGYFNKLLGLFSVKLPLWLTNDPTSAHTRLMYAQKMTNLQAILDKTQEFQTAKAEIISAGIDKVITNFDKIQTIAEFKQLTDKSTLTYLATQYSSIDLPNIFGFDFAFNLPALLIVCLVTMILIKGIKEAAGANNIIVIIKICAVLFVILVGAFALKPENWVPFIPDAKNIIGEDGNTHSAYGWGGIFGGAAAIFFAYIGFDAVSTQAGEAINPKKDMPFAIITSLLVCTVLYIAVSLVLTGMINYKDIVGDALKAPVAAAFESAGMPWAVLIITAAATIGLISVMLVMMLGQTRIFLGMAKDGLIPNFFKVIHPTFKTPYKSTILVGFVVSTVAAFTPIGLLGDMTSFGTLFAFAMVCGAVWILRRREPQLERGFKVPALPLIATLGIGTNLFLIINLNSLAQLLAMGWLVIGVIVYFLYGRKHSNLNKTIEE
jgi:basic amino acid/polyamine antiporter, APA family